MRPELLFSPFQDIAHIPDSTNGSSLDKANVSAKHTAGSTLTPSAHSEQRAQGSWGSLLCLQDAQGEVSSTLVMKMGAASLQEQISHVQCSGPAVLDGKDMSTQALLLQNVRSSVEMQQGLGTDKLKKAPGCYQDHKTYLADSSLTLLQNELLPKK